MENAGRGEETHNVTAERHADFVNLLVLIGLFVFWDLLRRVDKSGDDLRGAEIQHDVWGFSEELLLILVLYFGTIIINQYSRRS